MLVKKFLAHLVFHLLLESLIIRLVHLEPDIGQASAALYLAYAPGYVTEAEEDVGDLLSESRFSIEGPLASKRELSSRDAGTATRVEGVRSEDATILEHTVDATS